MYYDVTYILVIIAAVLCMAASAGVKSTYNHQIRHDNIPPGYTSELN